MIGALVLTTTAVATCPFFIIASGYDSLILTFILSPIAPIGIPFLPKTPINDALFAPVLSATLRMERSWIIL